MNKKVCHDSCVSPYSLDTGVVYCSDQFTKSGCIKGELQRQNKLISSERPFKILQNETKIIKIGQAVLEIFNFKDRDLDNFTRKNDRKAENVVFLENLHRLKNNRLCDVRNDKCTYQQ